MIGYLHLDYLQPWNRFSFLFHRKYKFTFLSLISYESCSLATGFALIGLAQLIFGQCLIQSHVVIDQWVHGILDITSLLPPAVTIPKWTRNRVKDKEQRKSKIWKQTMNLGHRPTGTAHLLNGRGNLCPNTPVLTFNQPLSQKVKARSRLNVHHDPHLPKSSPQDHHDDQYHPHYLTHLQLIQSSPRHAQHTE
jgi:hypothetical protein